MPLRPYQQAAVEATWNYLRAQPGNPCIVLPTGCHAAGTRILMADGSTKAVEDIVVGDQVMSPWSQSRTVLQLARGTEPLFRITPKKGVPFVVNGNHVLSLRTTNEGKKFPSATTGGELESITVNDYLAKSKSWKHLRKLWRTSVNFPTRERPDLCPWALGALLGDGSLLTGVNFSSPDSEILNALWDEMSRHGLEHAETYRGGAWHVRFVDPEANRVTPNRVFAILRELNLDGTHSGEKFVPDCYKLGSRHDRLNVLAGLLDTDGHYDARGGYDYISKSRRLSDDVTFIARSLGLAAYCTSCEKRCQTGAGGTYWRVHISGQTSIIPMRCSRKKAKERKQKKSVLVTGFSVEPIGGGEFFGFTLDGDHLYLTDDFTAHHNSGKTHVMAAMIQEALTQWPGTRICVLAHVRELVRQNAVKLKQHWPEAPLGIYSASLGRRDTFEPVIFASIQSVAKRAMHLGRFDLLLIDEAHRIPLRAEGQYRQFIDAATKANPNLRVCGLTATPYRLGGGPVCGPDYILNEVAYEARVGDLIRDGYLSRLVSKAGAVKSDLSAVHIRQGEYVKGELERAMNKADVIEAACTEIVDLCSNRKAWIVFCAGIKHCAAVKESLTARGIPCATVTSKTPKGERDAHIEAFQRGKLRALINVNVLSEGFDATHVDAVILMRPTKSAALYYQQCGRGMRLHDGKKDCLILDYAGNIVEHGPVDAIRPPKKPGQKATSDAPVRECPECQALVPVQARECPECGYLWPVSEFFANHQGTASNAAVLSDEITPPELHEVSRVTYTHHVGKSGKPTLQVTYQCGLRRFREWICLEHGGIARVKAMTWWMARDKQGITPRTVEGALDGGTDRLSTPTHIRVMERGKYPEIVGHEFEPIDAPAAHGPHQVTEYSGTDRGQFADSDPVRRLRALRQGQQLLQSLENNRAAGGSS